MNRLKLYNPHPEWDDANLPKLDLDLKALEPERVTKLYKDQNGEYHLLQKKDGITHVISLDEHEKVGLLKAFKLLEEKKNE